MASMLHDLVTVDILLATYNGEKYLSEQLDSIIAQTYASWRIIAHDDGSTDNTLAILKDYSALYPDKIVLLEDEIQTRSAQANFSYLMTFSTAPYIVLCDQDDVWSFDKLSIVMALLQQADLVVHDLRVVDTQGDVIHDSFLMQNHSRQGFWNNFFHNSFIGCAMAFNRKVYDKVMPIPSNVPMHDWWIGLIAQLYGKVIFCDKSLMDYRRHNANASSSAQVSTYSFFEKVWLRMVMLSCVMQRVVGL